MTAKRLGIVGDVHAENKRLEVALRTLVLEGVDEIVCVGDIVDGPGDIEHAVDLLCEHCVPTVRGNHDRWFFSNEMRSLPEAHAKREVSAKAQAWLSTLPKMIELATVAGRLLVCHGIGEDDMGTIMPWDSTSAICDNPSVRRMLQSTDAPFILNGHSHRRMMREVQGRTLINAGTLFREHDPSFGMIDFETFVVRTWLFAPDLSIRETSPTSFEDCTPATRREIHWR